MAQVRGQFKTLVLDAGPQPSPDRPMIRRKPGIAQLLNSES
jgi:hypothetical protein